MGTGLGVRVARGVGHAGLALFLLVAWAERGEAANAISRANWDGGLPSVVVNAGESALASNTASASSMAGNPALDGSAWAHVGDWWSIRLGDSSSVTIRVQAGDAQQLSPGVAVWASGSEPFDGGTTGWNGEVSNAGFGTPHSFNAFGQLGDPGTLWMLKGEGGNMQEFIGYAVSGPSFLDPTGWGETIANGAYDMRLGSSFVGGVTGTTGPGFVELVLTGVQDGWFTIYVGGTDHSQSGNTFSLFVGSVPEPGTALLLALGLVGLRAGARRS